MLTLKLLHDDPEYVIRKLAVKNFDARAIVEKVIALDDSRKAVHKDVHSSFYLELLACNVNDCVHYQKLC